MAAVTGESLAVIHQAIRTVRGRIDRIKANGHAKRPVKGMHNVELVAGMAELGWLVVEADDWRMAISRHGRSLRLGEFLNLRGQDGPFIIHAANHYFAVSQGEICDTGTRLPLAISRFKRKRLGRLCWVRAWWRFDDILDDDSPQGAAFELLLEDLESMKYEATGD
jgi:hypothetical protein